MNTRILIVGHGRSGKDTAAEILSKITGIPYAGSTSWAAKERVAGVLGVHPQIAWEERHKNRDKWKRICDKLRETDQTILIRDALFSVNHRDRSDGFLTGWRGIVAGVRDYAELKAAKLEGLFHHILWIDNYRVPVDPTVTFTPDDCDEVIYNDGDLDEFRETLFLWAEKGGLIPGLHLSSQCSTRDIHRE